MERDTRIPVIFGQQPEPDDMVLLEQGQAAPSGPSWPLPVQAPGHLPGCFCCTGRSAAATALGALFRARSTGAVPFFTRLLVRATPSGAQSVAAALEEDALCRARYRPG